MTIPQKLFVGIILFLGLLLRLHNYDVYPQRGATSDEYTYSFLGQSLLTKGIPISWSHFGGYTNKQDLTIEKIYFPIVWPYFDHPPLNGIVVATWAILNGETTFEQISLSTIRLVPIFLTLISSVFLFFLLYRWYEYGIAILALAIYSVSTIMVASARVVMAENLLAPLLLGAMLFYERVRNNLSDRSALMLGIVAGLSIWTKELGVAVFFTIIGLYLLDKQHVRKIVITAAIFLTAVVGYGIYGYMYDWQVFISIVTQQASRLVGPETLWLLTSRPVLINKIFYDGWYLLGMIALFASFGQWKKHIRLLLPFLIYFLLLIGSLNREGEMGWYMITIFPFMAAASSIQLIDAWKKPHGMTLIAVLFVGLSLYYYLIEANFGSTQTRFRLVLLTLFVPYIYSYVTSRDRLAVSLQRIGLILLLVFTALHTYFYIHPA